MKEFSDLRTSLQESTENLEEHSGILQGAMPPNILILRRKSVRQFPDHTMVALYYNDKLDQYFSIPYGGDAETAITPGALKEDKFSTSGYAVPAASVYRAGIKKVTSNTAVPLKQQTGELKEEEAKTSQEKEIDRHNKTSKLWANRKQRWNAFKQSQAKQPKPLKEDVIKHLQKVKAFETGAPLKHKDGTQTKIDPTTASALLAVHGALKPEHQVKFAERLEHSRPAFHKMLDFTWKQVK